MNLIIDIGNNSAKFFLFNGEQIVLHTRRENTGFDVIDEWNRLYDIDMAIVSTVIADNSELQEKLDVWESDDFYKAVNIKTIIEYAQDTDNCDKNDGAIIKLMLLGLCANKGPDKVIRKIKTLKCGGKLNIGTVGQINPAATEVHNHYHNND